LKRLANKRDVPYQSLLKVYLAERVAAESARALSNKPLRRSKSPSFVQKTQNARKEGSLTIELR